MIKICVALLIISSVVLAETGEHRVENMATTYTDVKVGTGRKITGSDTVTVHATGKLANGNKFWSSKDNGGNPFTFTLGAGQLIKGWEHGVIGMQAGGIRMIYIPYAEAYGDAGAGGVIPPKADINFEIEMLSLKGEENSDL